MALPLVLDTDIGMDVDDAIALCFAALDPRIEPERKAAGDLTNSRAVIDACRPWHWRDQFPRVNVPTPEERRIAQEKFGHLFKH